MNWADAFLSAGDALRAAGVSAEMGLRQQAADEAVGAANECLRMARELDPKAAPAQEAPPPTCSFLYLASPYTPLNGEDVEERVHEAKLATAALTDIFGCPVFSPILHSHALADVLPPSRRHDHEYWMAQDLPILARAHLLVVLAIPGWSRSRGVSAEIDRARHLGIPVLYYASGRLYPHPVKEDA